MAGTETNTSAHMASGRDLGACDMQMKYLQGQPKRGRGTKAMIDIRSPHIPVSAVQQNAATLLVHVGRGLSVTVKSAYGTVIYPMT